MAVRLVWHSAKESHPGNRRDKNEDAVLNRPDQGLWAVADGMGGHEAGDLASQAITTALNDLTLEMPLSDAVDRVEDALVRVNDDLRLHARMNLNGSTMGSTVVAMLARDTVGVALWAGDSRLYRLRRSRLEQITRDHNPICDQLEAGMISEAEALAADTNIVTRAVGGQTELYLDVVVFDVDPDDTYLLCSDGLYREVTSQALIETMRDRDLDASASSLLAACLATPARDNVSLVLARPEAV